MPSEPITSTVQRIQVLREDVTAKLLKQEQVRDSHDFPFAAETAANGDGVSDSDGDGDSDNDSARGRCGGRWR